MKIVLTIFLMSDGQLALTYFKDIVGLSVLPLGVKFTILDRLDQQKSPSKMDDFC